MPSLHPSLSNICWRPGSPVRSSGPPSGRWSCAFTPNPTLIKKRPSRGGVTQWAARAGERGIQVWSPNDFPATGRGQARTSGADTSLLARQSILRHHPRAHSGKSTYGRQFASRRARRQRIPSSPPPGTNSPVRCPSSWGRRIGRISHDESGRRVIGLTMRPRYVAGPDRSWPGRARWVPQGATKRGGARKPLVAPPSR